jgi:predicted DNA-binding transcriptional regulator AlpA
MKPTKPNPPTPSPGGVYLRERDVRREYMGNIHRNTLWRWVRDGLAPKPYRVGPQASMWLRSELDAWVAARQHAQ